MGSRVRHSTRGLVMMGLMAVAACGHFEFPGNKDSRPPPTPPYPVTSAPPAVETVRPAPPHRAKRRPAPAPEAKEPEAVTVPPSPEGTTPPPSPPPLIGLSEQDTARLLGQPLLATASPPGKVWRYGGSGCQLDVYLFPDVRNGDYHTLDYTVSGGGEVTPDQCLGRVLAERRQR